MSKPALPSPYSVADATVTELRRQRDALYAQVVDLSAIVRTVPSLLTSARLDEAQGRQTTYDYTRAAKALAVRC